MTTYTAANVNAWYQAITSSTTATLSSADVATYVASLNSGVLTQDQVVSALEADSFTQNYTNVIIREYQAAFGRVPDQAGLAYWVGVVASSSTALSNIATIFADSAEFNARYGATATTTAGSALVTALYTNVLGRAPDAAGLAYWVAQGLTASQLLTIFAQSTEFVQNTAAGIITFQNLEVAGTPQTSGSLPVVTPTTSYTLTTGVDATGFGAFVNGQPTGNSTTLGTIGLVATNPTLGAADVISATGLNNTLTLVDASGATSLPAASVSGIQTLSIRSAGGVGNTSVANFDVSSWTGLTAVNVTQSTGADFIKAATTTAINVVDTAGTVTISGGSTQTVSTAGGVVLSGAVGAITATDTAQGAVASTIDGGTSVTLTNTATNPGLTTGAITIGGTTQPTGAVTVVQNLTNAAAAASNTTGGLITINGGSTVSVTETAAQAVMATASTNSKIVQSAVTVNGGAATTSVVVNEAAAVSAANTVLAATESAVVGALGSALVAGQSVTIGGLTFMAGSSGATVAQVAAAFAGLANGATTGAGTAYGTYSGTLSGWSSGAASGANTVTFVSSTAATNVTNLTATATGGATAPTVTTTQGAAAAGTGGVDTAAVTVLDANYAAGAGTSAGTITSVTANNFNGLTISDSNLSTLALSGGAGAIAINDASALVTAPTTTLALTLDGVNAASFADSNVYKTINITTQNNASTLGTLGDTALTALTVSGTKGLTITSSAGATTLKTVTVSGSAGLTATFAQATLTDINASGTSGVNVITFDSSKATYEGGSGGDTVTTSSSTVSKAITLGSGNDTLVLANGTTSLSANITGGNGTDILDMRAVDAATASGNAAFVTHISGFEVLGINTLAGAGVSIDVSLLGAASNVVVDAGAGAGTAANNTLSNFASGGTLTVNDTDNTGTAGVTLANTAWTAVGATSDTANIVLGAQSGATAFTVNSSGLDSVTVTANTTSTNTGVHTLTLVDTSTTSITVNGSGAVVLTATGDTALTTVTASANTGGFTMSDTGTATTVTGSATAANIITANTGTTAVTINGGSGSDILTANAGLDVLHGNGGIDTFVVQTASASTNVYTTVADFVKGDSLTLVNLGTETFATAKISLAGTASFTDYLNAATGTADNSSDGAITWFQFNGNTYVVEALGDHTLATGSNGAFVVGTDIVVALTGTLDLSHSNLVGATTNTLLFG